MAAFGHLERVAFDDAAIVASIINLRVPQETGGTLDEADWDRYGNRIETVVHLLCDAYLSEDLPTNVKVEGIFCPWPHEPEDGHNCRLCRHVIRGIPIQHLLSTDENGAASLTFLDLPGCISRRRDIYEWMVPILEDRLESARSRLLGVRSRLYRAVMSEETANRLLNG